MKTWNDEVPSLPQTTAVTSLFFACLRKMAARLCGFLLLCCLAPSGLMAQEPLPPGWKDSLRIVYGKPPKKEFTFEQYLQTAEAEFQRTKGMEKGRLAVYQPKPSRTLCGNGDFESGTIDPLEWTGGYATLSSSWTGGLASGLISNFNTHHTVVPWSGEPSPTDAITGIPVKHGGTYGLRIGNTAGGRGTELVSRTFTVTTPLMRFWYAVVLQDPSHLPGQQPKFVVDVKQYPSGTPIAGAVNFGNGSNQLVANAANPFFQSKSWGGEKLLWKNWSCQTIDLSNYVGSTVTVEFRTVDCDQGGHFGYAYIDDFCGSCDGDPQGNITSDTINTDCIFGKLCFKYELPKIGNTTGSVQIKLEILQNGVVVQTLNSPVLTSGSQYCFNFPCNSEVLNPALGGFDYVATGAFSISGSALPSKWVGSKPDGQIGGKNNDCKCSYSCCPGENLIRNGDFNANAGFVSQYTYQPPGSANSVMPGMYSILNAAQAATVSNTWQVQDHPTCAGAGKFLVVNGATGQSGPKKVWEQTVTVRPNTEYRFCAWLRDLKQCSFNVLPKVEFRFSIPSNITTTVNTTPPSCDWLRVTRTISTGSATTLNIQIWLDEMPPGDGNDLAIDDISLNEMQPLPAQYNQFTITTSNISGSTYNITATPVNPLPPIGCGYYWEVCQIDNAGNCLPGTIVSNPSQWWTGATSFPGYNGTGALSGTAPGVFTIGKRYKIRYGTWCECRTWSQATFLFEYNTRMRKLNVTEGPGAPPPPYRPVGN